MISDEEHARFLELMMALRMRRQYRHSRLIFFFENNNTNTATRDWALKVKSDPVLNSTGPVEVIQNDNRTIPEFGVRTTPKAKPQMISHANVFVETRTVFIAHNLVLHRECSDFIGRWASQMVNFSRHTKMSLTDPGKAPTITYHGKGYAIKDDIAMAFLICLYWSGQLVGARMLQQHNREEYQADFDLGYEIFVPLAF